MNGIRKSESIEISFISANCRSSGARFCSAGCCRSHGRRQRRHTDSFSLLSEASFAGGSIGTTAGSYAWHAWGWIGVCGTGGGLVLIAFLIWSSHLMSERS
ncbi:hypothetical protein PSTEL_14920 [Paenibacillus stellifer]|uniref:Uncharacterized protein n=1 Tax=Paenibacillus stellifer TaxID=169760 RepID=A0A089LTC5_9BACL|nr:hypothetical protein [Paenibacillus stellifer]AIQ64177.1 hypothetical protein PSTEL_14920 [Paenibacillus stellifer]